MTRFTTRVELHNADSDDYERLHDAMKAKGFSRLITDSEGKKYHLPTAEYNYDGNLELQAVLDRAKSAADTTGLKHSILTTESAGRRWSNLKSA